MSDDPKHIQETHEDRKDYAWCGVRIWSHDWVFQDLDHAVLALSQGTMIQPCHDCLKRVARIIRWELEGDAVVVETDIPPGWNPDRAF